jgi:multiple sugar transport system substrate-binding protein
MTKKPVISRRNFLQLSAMATAGATLVACASPTPTAAPVTQSEETPSAQAEATQAPATEAPQAEQTVTTISFMGWGGTEEDEGVRAAIAQFEKETPNIKVDWLHTPDNYAEKLLANIAAGSPPDTGFCSADVYKQWIMNDLLVDITDNYKADAVIGVEGYFVEPQESQRCDYNGKRYGFGSCWVNDHVFYNADIFEQEGIEPPSNDPDEAWDWSKFLEVSRALTIDENGKHPGENGFDKDNIQRYGVQIPWWYAHMTAFVESAGEHFFDPDSGLLGIDTPKAMDAIQKYADLHLTENVAPIDSYLDQLGMSAAQMLESGRLAMAVDGSWSLASLTKINATLGTAVLPMHEKPASFLGGHFHTIYKGTKKIEAAYKWLRFLATEFYQLQFCKIGLWLPSQTALTTTEGMKKWVTTRVAPGNGVHPQGFETLATKYVAQSGFPMYETPGFVEAFNNVISPAFDSINLGDAKAEDVLPEVTQQANEIIQKTLEQA